jgi:hypothetical protein
MLHQDASTHRWVTGEVWNLVVTMDNATGEHTSMFFCDQEGTALSFHGLGLSGFTTQDINRCQTTAGACALVYN